METTFSRIHGVFGLPLDHHTARMSTVIEALPPSTLSRSSTIKIRHRGYRFGHSHISMSTQSSGCWFRPSHSRSRFEFSRIQHELKEMMRPNPVRWVGYMGWVIEGRRTLDAANISRGVSFSDVWSFRSYLDAGHRVYWSFAWWQYCLVFLRFLFQNSLTSFLDCWVRYRSSFPSRSLILIFDYCPAVCPPGNFASIHQSTSSRISKWRAWIFSVLIYPIQISFCFRVVAIV